MTSNELSDFVKANVGPAGDLYLTSSKASLLIEWLTAREKVWNDLAVQVRKAEEFLRRTKPKEP